MTNVRLSPMTEQDYERFLSINVREYAEENVQAGYWSPADAMERSRKELERLLPEGVRTKGHHLFVVSDADSGQAIGHLWVRVEEGLGGRTGFIFSIYLDKDRRGRGFGRAVMRELDRLADDLGLRALALHVFAANKAAAHLYESSGYRTSSLNMVKEYPVRSSKE